MMNFLELPVLEVVQPLASFYVFKIKASDLLKIAFAEELQYRNENRELIGSQRKLDVKRLEDVAKYINTAEMAFPNAIILACNYLPEEGVNTEDPKVRWRIEDTDKGKCIIIPTDTPLAAIVDGQHRLKAFKFADPDRSSVELLCSVYFDLPNSYQAQLFATINSNQKRVDKSLAFEQFGFNIGDEPEKSWTPEKLAVFLSRRLNSDTNSPFFAHIKLAPKDSNFYLVDTSTSNWFVSTATIVEGILSLITSNPKRDRVEMQLYRVWFGRDRSQLERFPDTSPLRKEFINENDAAIYETTRDFFSFVKSLLWKSALSPSYIQKTVGVQALFDFLRKVLINRSSANLPDMLARVKDVDFNDNFFQASGVGRSRIRNLLLYANGMIEQETIDKRPNEFDNIARLLSPKQ
ncbi:DGQHR domain-containing protein [Hymenobacter negativus]|uniref:DGQHR domain-containing protein n=1 Tax=Hymenobacter negativus TaxID=2795026 RepID=A0ABS3QPI4_9BACT|nr:DGQHR domain-containing protein [Hymenobacter negativus]MBO2012580.1 DGQHR domain-containing protein [Hymenobacter negativus]